MSVSLRIRLLPLLAASLSGIDLTPAGSVAPARTAASLRTATPVVQINQDHDGLFRVAVPARGTSVRFVIDTGANVVVLTPADATRLGARPIEGGARRLRTAAGEAAMVEARIDGLVIAGRRLAPVRAVITKAATASLLGQSALGQFESVTLRGDRLELR